MNPTMTAALSHRVLVTHAAPEALAAITRGILGKLGYAILTPEEFEPLAQSIDRIRPDLRIVDERSLAEVPDEDGSSVPIIVLTGRHGTAGVDSRIVGAVKRPAGLHELYRLLQQVLEDKPRTSPRVPVHLKARCERGGREWHSSVLSISSNGCLVRSPEPLLPRSGPLCLTAEVAYQLVPDSGLIFHATAPSDREALSSFVVDMLMIDDPQQAVG